jgi:hypothetical protein
MEQPAATIATVDTAFAPVHIHQAVGDLREAILARDLSAIARQTAVAAQLADKLRQLRVKPSVRDDELRAIHDHAVSTLKLLSNAMRTLRALAAVHQRPLAAQPYVALENADV